MNIKFDFADLFLAALCIFLVFLVGSCALDIPEASNAKNEAAIFCQQEGYQDSSARGNGLFFAWSDTVWYECSSVFEGEWSP